MRDVCHYAFVQMHRVIPKMNYKLMIAMYSYMFILYYKCILVSDVDIGEAMHVWGREYMRNLYLPFNFDANLKLL